MVNAKHFEMHTAMSSMKGPGMWRSPIVNAVPVNGFRLALANYAYAQRGGKHFNERLHNKRGFSQNLPSTDATPRQP